MSRYSLLPVKYNESLKKKVGEQKIYTFCGESYDTLPSSLEVVFIGEKPISNQPESIFNSHTAGYASGNEGYFTHQKRMDYLAKDAPDNRLIIANFSPSITIFRKEDTVSEMPEEYTEYFLVGEETLYACLDYNVADYLEKNNLTCLGFIELDPVKKLPFLK